MNTEYHVINPELNQLELQSPPVDCCDIEAMFLKSFPMGRAPNLSSVSQIPYEMFAYKIAEKGKISQSNNTTKDKCCEPAKDEPSVCRDENDEQNTVCGDDNASIMEDPLPLITYPRPICDDTQSVCSEAPSRKSVTIKKPTQMKAKKDQGQLCTLILPQNYLVLYIFSFHGMAFFYAMHELCFLVSHDNGR